MSIAPLERRSLRELEPEALLARLAASGLRGRGGGGFPTARKWRAVRVEGGDPVVIGNGAEGEPGSIKDRHLMRTRPDEVVFGLLLAARGVGAREAVLFLKGSDGGSAAALTQALSGLDTGGCRVEVRTGDDAYVTGEETAILEVLEGRRPWPRPKPPLPAAAGLNGRPTLVQNVETLARLPSAIADPEGFRADEPLLVTVWGDVGRPGVHEVRRGTPIAAALALAGGPSDGIGMLFPAGPSATPLPGGAAETPIDPDALREAGSALGTASLLVVGARRCPVSVASSLADFFERESCGQCPPCSVGSGSLALVLRGVEDGGARPKDLADLAEAAGFMSGHGYCAHGRTGAASVTGLLRGWQTDVLEHLRLGRCPRPEDRFRPFDPDAPARRAIEALAC